MKRFLLICVALIAFAATNASGTNYQLTDQLQTHFVKQPQMQFTAIMAETQAWVIAHPVIAIQAQTLIAGKTICPDAFAWIDPGRTRYGKSILSNANKISLNKSDQIPNQQTAVNVSDYNITNHSYGLRY